MSPRQPRATKTLAQIWGDRIEERRKELHLSQAELAELVEVTQQTISKIENGAVIPLDRLKIKLAHRLATTPDELFPWPPMAELVAS